MYEKIISTLQAYWQAFIDRLPDMMVALVLLSIFVLLGRFSDRVFLRGVRKRWKNQLASTFVARLIKWIFYLVGIIIALDIMGFGRVAASMAAGVGLSAIIFGFAFKDIAENFIAGVLLAVNRPFKVGDIIEVSSRKGHIMHIDMRNTHIRTIDGRDIYIPNSMMIKDVLTNFTKDGLIRLEFMAGLDQNDDLEHARKLILNYLKSKKEILTKPDPNVIVETIGVSSIDLKIYFWIDIFKGKRDDQLLIGEPIRSMVIREVKDLLLANGFNLPSNIVEHKIYKKEEPIPVDVVK